MDENDKKIEIVSGNGKELDISEVQTHLNIAKPKLRNEEDKKKKVIIPKENK